MAILKTTDIVWRQPLPSSLPLGNYNKRNSALNALLFDGVPTVSGAMSAVESGADALAASGAVVVQGALTTSESGADTFGANGWSGPAGTVLYNDHPVYFDDELVIYAPWIVGTMAATEEGEDAFAGAGSVVVSGSFSIAEDGSDSLAIAGSVLVQGAMGSQQLFSDDEQVFYDNEPVVFGETLFEPAELDAFMATGIVRDPQKKRGGSHTTPRKRTTPKHIISTVESDEDRARALAEIMADEPEQPVIAEDPQVAPSFTPQPLPVIDLAPVIAAAQQAIEDAAQGAALQVAALEAQRLVELQAQREEIARQAAQAILEARLRDEDEATALIFIMATA